MKHIYHADATTTEFSYANRIYAFWNCMFIARMFYLQDQARVYILWYRPCYWWLFLYFELSKVSYLIQNKLYNLNKVKHFYDMVKVRFVIINVNIFTIYESLL